MIALLAAGVFVMSFAGPAQADTPESKRLSNDTFYQGLLDRKLVDLLDHCLKTDPPANELTELLMRRKMKLIVHDDPLADADKRQAALRDANELLARVIREYSARRESVDWRMELSQSLLYDEAEPYYTSIFYRGGTAADRKHLAALMDEAISVLTDLSDYLDREYARMDQLSIAEYEQLDETGYVLKIESAMPRTDYMLLWAKFYRALAMEPSEPQRRELLEDVRSSLPPDSPLLTEDHNVTHVQAQSLLLAGMVARRLGDYDSSIRYLKDAVETAEIVSDPQERRDLQWLVMLGSIEHVWALADAGRFDLATQTLADLKRRVQHDQPNNFGLKLAMGLLESRVAQTRAAQEEARGNTRLARSIRANAMDPLRELAARQPQYRDEIYACLYEQLAGRKDFDALLPFERCAVIAGHIREARRLRQGDDDNSADLADRTADEAEAIRLLDEAISLAQELLADRGQVDNDMYCEVLYNLGVAQYNRGLRREAAESFVSVAKDCAHTNRAESAATFAVEIAAQLANDPSLRQRDDVRKLHLETLTVLVGRFQDSESAEYWRFFLGQALEDQGQLDEAARVYAEVSPHQPHYLLALFRSFECRVASLKAYAAEHSNETAEIARRAADARRAVDRFRDVAAETPSAAAIADEQVSVERLKAEADVLQAELNVVNGVDRPEDALRTLADFESRHAGQSDLMGRVLRVRLVAYEATGQIDKARQVVPKYIASAPDEAAATIQALFDATRAEVKTYRNVGRKDIADRKAAAAQMLAEQLYDWANGQKGVVGPEQMYVLRLQLAESQLDAGDVTRATALFRQSADHDASRYDDGKPHDPRAVLGLARALQLNKQYAEALPLFNRMCRELDENSRQRFEALLGDLQCRTELGEPAKPIIDVIRQHRHLHPDLGGRDLAEKFNELQRRNEGRK